MTESPNIDEMKKFSDIILSLAKGDDVSYLDVIIEYCEKVQLEIDVAVKLFTPALLAKITEEARGKNLILKEPMLPL